MMSFCCAPQSFQNPSGATLRVGIKCTNAPTYYWSMFDHFHLHFFGGTDPTSGIIEVESEKWKEVIAESEVFRIRM